MKRRLLRFDNFLVFVFNMDRGERKLLRPDEVNQGLTDHGPHTLFPISVFTKGSFNSVRPGRDPWLNVRGSGGEKSVDCDTLVGHHLVALEDGSEYHCIVPRREIKYWDREVFIQKKDCPIYLDRGWYCYVADGKLKGFSEKLIHNTSDRLMVLTPEVDSVMAFIWHPYVINPSTTSERCGSDSEPPVSE